MPFGEGTHSNRRFRPYTLDFYTKVQVWGSLVRASLQVPSISKAIQKNDDVSSTLLYIKKGEKRRAIKREKSGAKKRGRERKIYIKKKEKKKREKEQASPTWPPQTPKCRLTPSRILLFYTFTVYHQGPWSIQMRYVCGLALVLT